MRVVSSGSRISSCSSAEEAWVPMQDSFVVDGRTGRDGREGGGARRQTGHRVTRDV
ncbi:hypothetical protein KTU01_31790 [Kocuria turfanensis]|uniref:Uncharacterized protein n=1 Tax=Kocuria turfanensis TaxID=388357 RepID=A0A512IH66_9MICC|nr:hypothetical protein KTU01_31790 [Kocuria turfanensis]